MAGSRATAESQPPFGVEVVRLLVVVVFELDRSRSGIAGVFRARSPPLLWCAETLWPDHPGGEDHTTDEDDDRE
jgi:hypothetical protein